MQLSDWSIAAADWNPIPQVVLWDLTPCLYLGRLLCGNFTKAI